jgi:hypothetical protein
MKALAPVIKIKKYAADQSVKLSEKSYAGASQDTNFSYWYCKLCSVYNANN